MKKITHAEIGTYLSAAKDHEINVCFVSPIGVGKTEAISKYCDDNGMTLHTLILSALEPSETLGVPIRKDVTINGQELTVLETALPAWAVKAASEPSPVIFIDELLTAPPETANPFLNFLTTKKIGPLDLRHAQIVFATNVESDTVGYGLAPNFLDRICTFELINDRTSTVNYLNEKLGHHGLIENLISTYSSFGEGSLLYETRNLSGRNFEKLASMALQEDLQNLLPHFYEGMTNLNTSLHSMLALKINILRSPEYARRANDAKLTTVRLRESADSVLVNFGQIMINTPFSSQSERNRSLYSTMITKFPRGIFSDELINDLADRLQVLIDRHVGSDQSTVSP